MKTRIPGLKQYQGRNPRGYFEDLSWEVKRAAQMWLWHFCKRWGRDLPQWRFAILVGQAKRLALKPPTSDWGRTMLAKRGGYLKKAMKARCSAFAVSKEAPSVRLKTGHGQEEALKAAKRKNSLTAGQSEMSDPTNG